MHDLGTQNVWKYGSSLSIPLPKRWLNGIGVGDTLWVKVHLDGTIEYARNNKEWAMPIVVRLKPPHTGIVTIPSVICRTHGIKRGDTLKMYTDSYSLYVKKENDE